MPWIFFSSYTKIGMVINVKHDVNITCRVVLKAQLDKLDIPHWINGIGEVEIRTKLSRETLDILEQNLSHYGIHILSDQKKALVQRIKNTIDDMVKNDEVRLFKISTYLSNQLHYSYAHLSNLFSEVTHTSIENYVILKKVDQAKELMIHNNLTLTEIAYRLNYSSVAHLSYQFKKTTGLTPTKFQRILLRRKEHKIHWTK